MTKTMEHKALLHYRNRKETELSLLLNEISKGVWGGAREAHTKLGEKIEEVEEVQKYIEDNFPAEEICPDDIPF